jgi:hypothetical protein
MAGRTPGPWGQSYITTFHVYAMSLVKVYWEPHANAISRSDKLTYFYHTYRRSQPVCVQPIMSSAKLADSCIASFKFNAATACSAIASSRAQLWQLAPGFEIVEHKHQIF